MTFANWRKIIISFSMSTFLQNHFQRNLFDMDTPEPAESPLAFVSCADGKRWRFGRFKETCEMNGVAVAQKTEMTTVAEHFRQLRVFWWVKTSTKNRGCHQGGTSHVGSRVEWLVKRTTTMATVWGLSSVNSLAVNCQSL